MKSYLVFLFTLLMTRESFGQIMFQKRIGLANHTDAAFDVVTTPDKGYMLIGISDSASIGPDRALLVKTDSGGHVLWSKTYPGGASNLINPTNDGGYLVSGGTVITKIDNTGNIQWSRKYGQLTSQGATTQTSTGEYVIIQGTYQLNLSKADNAGSLIWSKSYYDSSNVFSSLSINTALEATDGSYIFGGDANSSFGGGFFLAKATSQGSVAWARGYTVPYFLRGLSLIQASDGGYVIAGYRNQPGPTNPGFHVIKTDIDGHLEWARTYAGGGAFSVQGTTDGGYVFAGGTRDSVGYAYLIKTDNLGNTLWNKTYFGTGEGALALSVKQTPDNGFVIAGIDGPYIPDNRDMFLIKTDSLGNSGCKEGTIPVADSFFYPVEREYFAMSVPPDTTVIALYTFAGTGGKDSTLCSTLSTPETKNLTQSLSIYPNPTSGLVTIRSSELITRIEITSTNGALIYNSSGLTTTTTIDLSIKASGIYFYTITTKGGTVKRGKLILQ